MPDRSPGIVRFFKRLFSVRTILVLAFLLAGLVPALVLRLVVLNTYQEKTMENRMINAEGECTILASDIIQYDFFSNHNSEIIKMELEEIAYNYNCRILILDRSLMVIEDTYLFQEGKTLVSGRSFQALNGSASTVYDSQTGYAKIYYPIANSEGTVSGLILITLPDTQVISIRDTLDTYIIVVIVAFMLIQFVVSIFVSGLLLAPLKRMRNNIITVSEGDKDAKLEKRALYEYNQVAQTVNGMLSRIQAIDQSRDEFVANVSHELKTPMTSMKVLAESLVGQENVPVETYQDFMGDIVKEIDRENQIISDLLNLVKMDRTNTELNLSTVNVNELVELVLKRLRPIAQSRNIELVMESYRPVAAELDEVKFTLAVTNLVENAIKYNVEGGWVHLSVNADHKFFYVKVSDSGIGIPNDAKEQIFERFYRVDKARSRASGGTGLGLAITKSVVMLHKGTIKLYSKENEGTTFTVRIPLYYVNGGQTNG